MKPHFLLGSRSLDTRSGILDEGPTPHSSRHEPSRRSNTIYIPSNDSITPTVFIGLYSSPNRQIKNAIPHISGNAEINSFKSQLARYQPQKPLAGTRRAPLQQNFKPLQAGATTADVPGTGGGKENIPPWTSIARPAVQNDTLRTSKPKDGREKPLVRVALGKTQGNVVRVPKKIEHSPLVDNAWASTLKRAFSAIVIQRAWRSFTERRNKYACAIATARVELAYEVITRWWRGVKACKLREQTEQVKLIERTTEQTPRRKSAGHRSSVRQSQHNSGRRGIRRL
ncbi:hypothetical protein N7472_003156 [Penicillium cf. griseofulvum]|uniref:Uncharacterized protein n=1 Tax=Penicillium cf. griseofulvum TaxID=2972120 RepID=A0A9W9MSR2_9EURO|nr:hypothetical protein N7472_003156 [Penicillium cf. griseofulvum]